MLVALLVWAVWITKQRFSVYNFTIPVHMDRDFFCTFYVSIDLAMKPLSARLITASCFFLLLYAQAIGQDARPDVNTELFGNPYIIREWSDGAVKFTSGRVVYQFKLRFDCVRNMLLLQFQGSTFAAESKVKEFVIYTQKKKDSLVFRKGFPSVDKGTDNTYYQVLLEDKLQLVRLVSKNIVEEKELVSSTNATRGHLEEEEKYYLLKDGVMIHLPAGKEEILKALPDKADALSAFINEKRLRFRTPEDYTLLAKKYIELMQ